MIKYINKLKAYLLHYSWDLAYGHYQESIINDGLSPENYNIIRNPYKEKWFADPFIYKDTSDYLELFVEEFDYSVGRGRIGHLVISKQSHRIEKLTILLEKDSHLSFPVIYRREGKVFVHPENSASGKSYMYRFDEGLDRLVDPVEVLSEPVADAIIVEKDGKFVMYATKVPVPNGKEQYIYQADSFFGPYIYKGSKVYDKAYARMAGAFVRMSDGQLIRPAQDCDGGDYGKAVLFMGDNNVVSSLFPPVPQYAGLHTFNTLGNTFIIDLKKYDYPWLYRLKTYIKK